MCLPVGYLGQSRFPESEVARENVSREERTTLYFFVFWCEQLFSYRVD